MTESTGRDRPAASWPSAVPPNSTAPAPTDLLRWTDEHFGGTMLRSVASNMQDAVLVDLAAKVRPGVDVLFLDTGYHFVETIGTRDAVEAVYDVNVRQCHAREHRRQAGRAVRQGPVRPRAQRVLPDAQGRAAEQGAAGLLRVGDRASAASRRRRAPTRR